MKIQSVRKYLTNKLFSKRTLLIFMLSVFVILPPTALLTDAAIISEDDVEKESSGIFETALSKTILSLANSLISLTGAQDVSVLVFQQPLSSDVFSNSMSANKDSLVYGIFPPNLFSAIEKFYNAFNQALPMPIVLAIAIGGFMLLLDMFKNGESRNLAKEILIGLTFALLAMNYAEHLWKLVTGFNDILVVGLYDLLLSNGIPVSGFINTIWDSGSSASIFEAKNLVVALLVLVACFTTFVMNYQYMLRMITIAFLIICFPFVVFLLVFPSKRKALGQWLQLFSTNVFLQFAHALVLSLFFMFLNIAQGFEFWLVVVMFFALPSMTDLVTRIVGWFFGEGFGGGMGTSLKNVSGGGNIMGMAMLAKSMFSNKNSSSNHNNSTNNNKSLVDGALANNMITNTHNQPNASAPIASGMKVQNNQTGQPYYNNNPSTSGTTDINSSNTNKTDQQFNNIPPQNNTMNGASSSDNYSAINSDNSQFVNGGEVSIGNPNSPSGKSPMVAKGKQAVTSARNSISNFLSGGETNARQTSVMNEGTKPFSSINPIHNNQQIIPNQQGMNNVDNSNMYSNASIVGKTMPSTTGNQPIGQNLNAMNAPYNTINPNNVVNPMDELSKTSYGNNAQRALQQQRLFGNDSATEPRPRFKVSDDLKSATLMGADGAGRRIAQGSKFIRENETLRKVGKVATIATAVGAGAALNTMATGKSGTGAKTGALVGLGVSKVGGKAVDKGSRVSQVGGEVMQSKAQGREALALTKERVGYQDKAQLANPQEMSRIGRELLGGKTGKLTGRATTSATRYAAEKGVQSVGGINPTRAVQRENKRARLEQEHLPRAQEQVQSQQTVVKNAEQNLQQALQARNIERTPLTQKAVFTAHQQLETERSTLKKLEGQQQHMQKHLTKFYELERIKSEASKLKNEKAL